MTMQDLGPVGVPGGGGAVFVQDQRPTPPVDHDLVMVRTQQDARGEAGGAAVRFVLDVVDLAGLGGLVAAARQLAAAAWSTPTCTTTTSWPAADPGSGG